MRVKQKVGEKGSLRWMQHLVNDRVATLDAAVASAIGLAPNETIKWLSPRREDEFAEYRDASWLKLIGRPELVEALRKFWPSRGPQWDALAQTSKHRVILVEAKAHTREIVSPSSAAGAKSTAMIDEAMQLAKAHFAIPESHSWTGAYYQYANRLAHLYFLRKNGVDAHLVFLYLLNDPSLGAPATRESWTAAINKAHTALGLPSTIEGVHEVFVDTQS
jgi:hypothetical protein